ncbi:MAG: histidine phosphatase family protein [Pseudomonadota bacterium]
MQLYLIRHPKPEIATGTCYGQADIAVNDVHCQSVFEQLQASLPADIAIFSSPLQRCKKLALLLNPESILDSRLMEMHFGKWEMQSWDVIPRSEIDAWAEDVLRYAPGGGETVIAMAARVIDFLHDLAEKKLPEAALVAHAGSLGLIVAYEAGMLASELAQRVAREKKPIQFGECILHQIKLC